MQSSAMMPTFPWSKSKQSQPSTSYSSLKQEEHEASPGSDDGLISGDSAKLNRQLHLRKTFMVSLIFNGAFFIALVILYSGNFVHPRHKRLLESPVPQCSFILFLSCVDLAPDAKIKLQFPLRSEHSSLTLSTCLSLQTKVTWLGRT